MRLFLIWPDKDQEVVNLIEELQKCSHEVLYWVGYVGRDAEAPSGTIFHSYQDAAKALPAKGVKLSEFPPADEELISKLYHAESLALTIMNRLYDNWPVDKRKKLYYDLLGYWRGLLNKYKPDIIIFSFVPHFPYDFVLFELARMMGIKTLMFLDTRIPGRLLHFENFWDGSGILKKESQLNKGKKFSVSDLSEDIQRHYQIYTGKDRKEAPPHIQYQKGKFSFNLRPFFFKILKSIKGGTFFRKVVGYFQRTIQAKKWDLIREPVIRLSYEFRNNLKKEYQRAQSLPDFNKKFVYVPLQVQPECSTTPQGGVFADQILMLETLAAALPPDWVIYAKEHPIQWPRFGLGFFSHRYPGFYRKIAELPGVALIPIETDSYELIKKSQAVATISGAAGWEAMLWSKPAIIFGYPWYKDCPTVLSVRDWQSCKEALEKIKNGFQVDQQEIINYLKALEKATIKGFVADSAGAGALISRKESAQNIIQFIIHQLNIL